MTNLPPGLDDFGVQLRNATAADIASRRPARRRRRLLRPLLLPVTATVLAGAVGASAVSLIDSGKGPAIEADPGMGVGVSPKDPGVVTASAVPDPAGGPPWVVRVYTNGQGLECAQVGRLRRGLFGEVQGGKFRELPPDAPGTCGPEARPETLTSVERRADPPRTVVFGLSTSRGTLRVSIGSEHQDVRPAGLGAYVTVFSGVRRGDVAVDDGLEGRP